MREEHGELSADVIVFCLLKDLMHLGEPTAGPKFWSLQLRKLFSSVLSHLWACLFVHYFCGFPLHFSFIVNSCFSVLCFGISFLRWVSQCSSVWPRTHRGPSASASPVLGIKVSLTTTSLFYVLTQYPQRSSRPRISDPYGFRFHGITSMCHHAPLFCVCVSVLLWFLRYGLCTQKLGRCLKFDSSIGNSEFWVIGWWGWVVITSLFSFVSFLFLSDIYFWFWYSQTFPDFHTVLSTAVIMGMARIHNRYC